MSRDPYICAGCNRRFTSLRVFDAHRVPVGADICADPATLLTNKGLAVAVLNQHGEWGEWRPDLNPPPWLTLHT